MKLIILPLIIASVGIAEAKVYKCPEKSEGRYTYQEKPCTKEKGSSDQNKVVIMPTNKRRVAEAVEKLNKDIEVHQAKKDKKEKAVDKNQTEINVTLPPRDEPKTISSPKENNKIKDENQESSSDENNEGG